MDVSFAGPHGIVRAGWQAYVVADRLQKGGRRILALTRLKLVEQRLMTVPGDVTPSVQRERLHWR